MSYNKDRKESTEEWMRKQGYIVPNQSQFVNKSFATNYNELPNIHPNPKTELT